MAMNAYSKILVAVVCKFFLDQYKVLTTGNSHAASLSAFISKMYKSSMLPCQLKFPIVFIFYFILGQRISQLLKLISIQSRVCTSNNCYVLFLK